MKSRIMIACLGLVSAGFALDEYLPVQKGAWELDAGYGLIQGTGRYDADGASRAVSGTPVTHLAPLQIKYGLARNLALEVFIPLAVQNDDAGGKSGLDRPELAVKYARPHWAYGYFVNVVLPVGLSGFASDPAPGSALGAGLVYDNRFEAVYRVVGMASYQYSVPGGDNKNQDALTVMAKPERIWSARLGTYLGLKYALYSESRFNGSSRNDAGSLATVFPGVNIVPGDKRAYEVNVPVTVSGKNQAAIWGVRASVHYAL